MEEILTIILGGGKGNRLQPLTTDRCKPACPFGGKYRLVDIAISNSINSGFRRIYVLTQFNSASLHLHIGRTYNFDPFSQDFCEILAAEQNAKNQGWYVGTADAVRKNLQHFRVQKPSYYMILSGDQLYRMDLRNFMKQHTNSGADLGIAVTPVTKEEAYGLGIVHLDKKGRIDGFKEKPEPHENIDAFRRNDKDLSETERQAGKYYLASMGIYIFNSRIMEKSLDNTKKDFGSEILPEAIGRFHVDAYVYRGYWEDIGTIASFYTANINLGSTVPNFNLYDQQNPIYTHRRDLPPTKINASTLIESLASEGSIITSAYVKNSIIGIRSVIKAGVELDGVYLMGTDSYETPEQKAENAEQGLPDYGIGEDTKIRRAIIDRNTRIGSGCRIGLEGRERYDGQYDGYEIQEGIITTLKGAVIKDGTEI